VTWADFYLVCFVVGLLMSVVMFFAGGMHIHLPGMHGHFGIGHGSGAGHATHLGPVNPFTLTAFLAWFGGTGYLLSRHSSLAYATALIVAGLAGTGGAAIIYLFLAKVLTSADESLDPADFEMVGVLGKLSVRIREGGTGEMIYSQAGTRRVCGARSEDGLEILKGTEVVVTRYENGIAYVRRWSELSGEESDLDRAPGSRGASEVRPQ